MCRRAPYDGCPYAAADSPHSELANAKVFLLDGYKDYWWFIPCTNHISAYSGKYFRIEYAEQEPELEREWW